MLYFLYKYIMDKVSKSITKFQNIFKEKMKLSKLIRNDLDSLNNTIIKLMNNIHTLFLIKRINNEKLNTLNTIINKLYDKYKLIYNFTSIRNLQKIGYLSIYKKIIDYEVEIKSFFNKICLSRLTDIIEFIGSNKWNDSIMNVQLQNIQFYNSIFFCCNCKIDSKYNHIDELKNMYNGDIFFKKIKNTDNMIDELNGSILYLYINNKVLIIEGFFKNDNLNIIKNNSRFKSKLEDLNKSLELESIPIDFSKKYIEQLSLRDYIVNSLNDITDQISIAYEKLHFYKDMSLTELLLTFNTSNLNRQREMLTILILSDSKNANLACLMYDIILKKDSPIKAKQLYLSLHHSVQKLFDIAIEDFNDEIEKFKKISINDISFDKKIAMCDTSEENKLKALEKFKQLKGGGGVFGGSSNDSKVEAWLNGFLKIPFNIYKDNNVINFIDNFPLEILELKKILINRFNLEELKDFNDNDFKKPISINSFIKKLGKILMSNKLSMFYNRKISKTINSWNEYKLNRKIYIKEVRQILDNAVYGNDEGKNQIEKLIGQWINGKMNGAIIGLQGPPGVGKTTLAKKGLCKCLKDNKGDPRPFAFLPLGGATNGSYLIGHSYTYVGSTWGRLVDILMESKCMNPIIFIDELDKVSKTNHGSEIIGILTHLTDLTQNDEINDKFFSGIKFDFSKCLFIFSYNNSSLIDPILRDRITEVNIKPLTTKDKLEVVNDFMLPEIIDCVGLDMDEISIDNEVITHLIETYTYEAGVRKLKEKLLDIIRYINLQRIYGDIDNSRITINKELIDKILEKKPKISYKKIAKKPMIGYVNGLFATSAGVGGLTIIEVVKSFSDQKLGMILTGSQGDVMKESMKCAKTIAWNLIPKSIKEKINLDWETNGNWGLHIHTPDTAQPKDGPSAGGAITLGIISRLTGVPILNTIATTGEIDLNGNIKKIGGLSSKILGAYKAGIKKIFIPKENKNDLDNIKKDNLLPTEVEIVLITHIKDLVANGLVKNDLIFNYDNI